ncbi:hypothetical protein GP486_008499 [Trichoglossum hirsutum]|uniref:Early meiotic induction protein 1 n=1 Tax=Trichoglossum hirsutum TaxID=265104 RepID=A0A9P8L5I8_9PEZI|nr:hypothetical protein GP486_008499 [Trichoglossum hirsutum]
MGWWSRTTTTPPRAKEEPEHTSAAPKPPTRTRHTTTLTRDEQADLELQAILQELDAEHAAGPGAAAAAAAAAADTQPESLYPTSMSCRQAFDMAFYCQSLGGQFQNIYRYGGLRDCSESWRRFRFCMRAKSWPEPRRAAMVQEHYRQRAAVYKMGPSSEDVWEVRKHPVVGAFMEDPDVG